MTELSLVDRPVRLDARIGLRDAGAVAEAGLPRVSRPGVDPRQPHGLVPASRHGGEYREDGLGAGVGDLDRLVHVRDRVVEVHLDLLSLDLHGQVEEHAQRQVALQVRGR